VCSYYGLQGRKVLELKGVCCDYDGKAVIRCSPLPENNVFRITYAF
jgi:hypothetical protein